MAFKLMSDTEFEFEETANSFLDLFCEITIGFGTKLLGKKLDQLYVAFVQRNFQIKVLFICIKISRICL